MGLPRPLTSRAHLITSAQAACLILAACALPTTRPVPGECEFPDGAPLTFAGTTTMADLGIPAPGQEREAVYAWVTAAPIHFPSASEPHRAACVEHDDGTIERSAYPGPLFTRTR